MEAESSEQKFRVESSSEQEKVHVLTEDALYFYKKARKGRGIVPPPTPDFDINYEREFEIPNIDVKKLDEIPVVHDEGIRFCIENLGHKLGLKNYEYDLIQFWLLDILTDCLWKAQDIFNFTEQQQVLLLDWVSTIFKTISDPLLNISRKDFLRLLKETIYSVYKEIAQSCDEFPSPNVIRDNLRQQLETIETQNEEEESESEVTTISCDSSNPSHSTFSIHSNEPIKISPEFDIREHISKLKENNPLVHSYCDVYASSDSSHMSQAEEEEYCQQRRTSDNSLYKADLSTPPWYRNSYSGFKFGDDKCMCKQVHNISLAGEFAGFDDLDYKQFGTLNTPTSSAANTTATTEFEYNYKDNALKIQTKTESKEIVGYLTKNSCPAYNLITDQSTKIKVNPLEQAEEKECESDNEMEAEKQFEEELLREWAYFKLMEQRGWDMDDPRVGWVPWVSYLEDKQGAAVNVQDFIPDEDVRIKESSDENCDDKRTMHFKMLKAIVDFVFEYFYENFHFTLIKLAFRSTPNIITHKVNEKYHIPKVIKQEFKRPKETPKRKEKKEKASKKDKKSSAKKSKSDKSKKSGKSSSKSKGSKDSKKGKKEKPGKKVLTPAEKAELERLRILAEEEEIEMNRREENRVFMFPLADAASEHLFMSIFENWVMAAADDGNKKKKGKKGKK